MGSVVISLLRQMSQQSKYLNNNRVMIGMLTDDLRKSLETRDTGYTTLRLDLIQNHVEEIATNLARMKLITDASELLYELVTNEERNNIDDTLFKNVYFEGRRFLLVVSFSMCIWADISEPAASSAVADYMIESDFNTSDFLKICDMNEVEFGFLWGSAASCSETGPAV